MTTRTAPATASRVAAVTYRQATPAAAGPQACAGAAQALLMAGIAVCAFHVPNASLNLIDVRLSEIRMRDPFVLELASGGFVLFGTTDTNLWGGPATGFDCFTSDDLETWQGPIPAFRPPAGFWADTQFWAPEVHALDGRFYMFATFASSDPTAGPRGVQVLVADDPTGPYLPWSDGPVTPRDVPCLDGTLFVDDDEAPWLVYSRGAEGTPRRTARTAGRRDVRATPHPRPDISGWCTGAAVQGVRRSVEQAAVVPRRRRTARGAQPRERPAVHRRPVPGPLGERIAC